MGILSKLADEWDPQIRDREINKRKIRVYGLVGPTCSHTGSCAPPSRKKKREEALSLKSSEIDPFVYILLAHIGHYINLYMAYEHQTYSNPKTLN